MARLKYLIGLLIFVGLILSGCSGNAKGDLETSPIFTNGNMTLHGVQGKIGFIKVNGEGNEPEFLINEGRLYQVYFLEKDFSGKSFEITAIHEEDEEAEKHYIEDIVDKQSGAKIAFNKEGLWKISVSVDEKPYTNFIIKAE